MSREPGVRPFPFNSGNWRRRSHSDKKDSVGADSLEDGAASVQNVPPIALKHAVVLWLSKNCIVLLYFSVSLALLLLLVYLSFFAATMNDGSQPDFLSCRSWGFGTSCGLWGVDCRPFASEWTAFRCPTRCTLDQSSSMAVFGSGPYRADSRICRAAAHTGVIGPNGGCAFYRFAGAADAFYSSTSNGVTTKEFLSWFPKTIMFKEASSSYCSDLSWWILSVGFIATAGFGLLPRARPDVMFYLLVTYGFFYTRLVGQPSSQDYRGISVNAFGEVIFLLAASTLVYRIAASDTLSGWQSLTLKRKFIMWTLCYVAPYHVMINMNLIGFIPWLNVDLGGYEELHANIGTYVVFTLVGIGALFLASQLFRSIYLGGKWRAFVAMYMAVLACVLVSWALFPSTSFHLHHTMLGALIIPVTSFPTPAAAFSQAAALGLFIQGYARWGWHSYLDTIPTHLTITVPENAPNSTNVTASEARVVWDPLESVQAYSLRLNRVEVYRGVDTFAVVTNLKPNMTYFVGVAGVASWGTDGRAGPLSNFTTLKI
ncbi:LCCL domain-containing protein [Phytophthora infestans]|uniref:LCCL domain-containing protein n=1 Tax=Phytophthora infestans TaxID=4787 RepID=A0A8S9U9T4_PHYIN|nr:LCCL domain-containing protein [Phytophthora infestans]